MRKLILFSLFATVLLLICCKDDKVSIPIYDPSQPLECTKFIPDSGGVGTQLVIQGKNFGADTSQIKVYVNDKRAFVINSNGEYIYAVVPARAGTGKIRVEIGKGEQKKINEFTNDFLYHFQENVSTLVGQSNEDGTSAETDGTLANAWLETPITLAIDHDGDLYVNGWKKGIRIVSPTMDRVTSPISPSGEFGFIRSPCMSVSGDTLFAANDQASDGGCAILYSTRDHGFMNPKTLVRHSNINGMTVNPVDGNIFYSRKQKGEIFRWDKDTKASISQINLGVDYENSLCFSKDGKTLYIIGKTQHVVFKATYDFGSKTLKDPTVFVGKSYEAGNQTGIGQECRLDTPCQGVCDEDGNLYICDSKNACIRKVTPAGVMTTYAGVPKEMGYKDGLPSEAKFNYPEGITIDKNGVIYVCDARNHRIRQILIE